MANAQTAIFKFESVNPIRSIIIDGQPWFVAQDVCSALRIQNVITAMRKVGFKSKDSIILEVN